MEENICLKPSFENKNAICFACDNKFVPYFLVALTSLCKHSKQQNNYEIVVLETQISEKNKKVIMSYSKSNINIRFVDMDEYLKNFDTSIFFTGGHYSVHTYYRFFITDIFKNYNKVLYLDSDIVLTTDINEIFKYSLENCYIGATRDVYMPMYARIKDKIPPYLIHVLKLSKVRNYFQAGVLMFNIPYCIKNDLKNKLINRLKEVKKPLIVDQDILNSVCEKNIEYIDGEWNFDTNVLILEKENKNIEKEIYNEFEREKILQIQNKPKIVHFAGPIKPWNDTRAPKFLYFWKYAIQTKCFHIIFKNFIKSLIPTKKIKQAYLIFRVM